MIKFGAKKGKRDKNGGKEETKDGKGGKKAKAFELRLRTECTDIDLPHHAEYYFPNPDDLSTMNVKVDLSTEDSMWSGAVYNFTIVFTNDYPHVPPKAHCDTPVYHPNIDIKGNVCLNILRKDWNPVLGVNSVILGLIFLFVEPNPEDPLNHEAAELMRDDFKTFEKTV